jgi:LAS seventeen-binding protein 5
LASQIHHVNSEQWLGALLHANDELVTALMTFEQLDRSIDADSDSDDEMAHQAHLYRRNFPTPPSHCSNLKYLVTTNKGKESDAAQQLAGLHIGASVPPPIPRPAQPPRPVEPEEDEGEEDENDPFGDKHAVSTPAVEKPEPRWYVSCL